jgi:hypothetical protein
MPMVIRIWIEKADPLTGSAAAEARDPIRFEGWMELLRAISELVSPRSASDVRTRGDGRKE